MSDDGGEDDDDQTWVKLFTEDGKPYFYHPGQSITQWEEPEEYRDIGAEPADALQLDQESDFAYEHEAGDEEEGAAPMTANSGAQGKPKWVKKQTASFGMGKGADAGEVYYVNQVTGETVWDKPDDFVENSVLDEISSKDDIILAEIDEDTSIEDAFDLLDIHGDIAVADRQIMLEGQ